MDLIRVSECNFKEQLGNKIAICGVLISCEARPMKNGNQSLTLVLKDKDKRIDIKWFDVSEEFCKSTGFLVGETYDAIVDVKAYDRGKDGISCILVNEYFKKSKLNKEACTDWEDNRDVMYNEINRLLGSIAGTIYGKIALKLLKDNWNNIVMYPAASSMHHSGFGGLLVHTGGVAVMCEKLADYYNSLYGPSFVNKDLLIACALLHDIGKVRELTADVGTGIVEYSKESMLLHHIEIGIAMISIEAEKFGVGDSPEILEMLHLIASHHGRLEWGSSIEPSCIEADILSTADLMDSTANRRYKKSKDLDNRDGKVEWSSTGKITYYKVGKSDRAPEI